jgi:hypothetical protein
LKKKLRLVLIVVFGLISVICLLNGQANVYPGKEPESFRFTLTEVVGLISGVISIFMVVVGFLLKRSVFGEIDGVKASIEKIDIKKQDKSMCEQIESVACRDREEIKKDIKDGVKKFGRIDRNIDRIMLKMKLPTEDDRVDE